MFSHIVDNINSVHNISTSESDLFMELNKRSHQLHLEFEEANNALDEINKKLSLKEEEIACVNSEEVDCMSQLSYYIQNKHDLSNTVDKLTNKLLSTEFDLKKYSKMVISSKDLETLSHIKKTFLIYKNILKIHFDYSNGPKSTIQKGYLFNKLTMRLTYFEFNKEQKTANEISEYLWTKMKSISNNQWREC